MITTEITEALLRGAQELERTGHGLLPHRLPAWARAQTDDPQLAMVEAQPSGVRLSFRTTATTVELDTLPTRMSYTGLAPRPQGVYDLLVDGRLAGQAVAPGGNVVSVDLSTGASEFHPGPVGTVAFTGLAAGDKEVELWLPHNETTHLLALRTDAPVTPSAPRPRVWLHHGSSISHGSNAASPSGIWPALAATRAGVDLVNLGMGGSALLDPFTARTMRDLPADLISVKIGINLVNADLMRLRAFTPAVHGFLDTIRDGHPDTPLLVISPIHCAIHEDTPGPGAFDPDAMRTGEVKFIATGTPAPGKLTLRVIRAELSRIVAQRARHDPHLHHLDGLTLYGEPDTTDHPLPDRLHPDAPTHRLMADRFTHHAFTGDGPFATPHPAAT